MGEVYAAFDLILGVPVALKTLHARKGAHHGRLLEEVRLARKVSRPGICRVYDAGEHGGTPFLTMELILGEDPGRSPPPDRPLGFAGGHEPRCEPG